MATHRRFDRAARLLGDDGLARLASSTVTVFGVGGVGSYAAEGLIRSGVGRVILVDFDRICVTNVNRQVHALKGTLGKPKVEVMAERLRLINPDAEIVARPEFYSAATSARLLAPEPDVVIDAIDNLTAKMHLIATCVRERLRLVSAMGAAGRLDPTAVRVVDLADTRICPFARDLRKSLKKKHGLDCTVPTGVHAVYSEEAPHAPHALAYDDGGFDCVCPGGTNGLNDCEHKHRVEGSVAFVPSAFGMAAAATAVKLLLAAALAIGVLACGDGGGGGGDGGLDGAGDPCAAGELSVDDFYRCRGRLTCALLSDCRATDTSALDCDALSYELFANTPQDRRVVEDSLARGAATWDGRAAAACLAGVAARGCTTFELAILDRLTCSGAVGTIADDQPCTRALECATPGAACSAPAETPSCAFTVCVPPRPLGAVCADRRCEPGDHCVRDSAAGDVCRSGAIDQRCDTDDDCDEDLFCLDGLGNGTGVGRCFPARAVGATCRTDRECAGELLCELESTLGPGTCQSLRADDATCDDSFVCLGQRYCDLAAGGRGTCHPMPRLGGPCATVGGIEFCGTELVCEAGRCRSPGRRGERCVPNLSGLINPLDCDRGLFCDAELTGTASGTCRPLQPDLEQCASALHCASGLCDRGVCTPIPVCGG